MPGGKRLRFLVSGALRDAFEQGPHACLDSLRRRFKANPQLRNLK
jgi:hypothetical protein